MTKTLDLIKRFDRQVYYNTEPFERALTDNPSAKSFAIVVANNANGFAFVPVHLKRFISNKTIIGTIERPEPNIDPYVQLQRTAERLLDAFDPKEQYRDDMKNIIDMGLDDKYAQVFQALDILVEQATKKDETLEKQARDLRQRFLDSFTQYVEIQVETYREHYDAEYKKNLTVIEYSIAMDDIGFKLSDITGMPEPTLKGKIMGNIFIIRDWLDKSIATMRDCTSYSDREGLIQMKLNALTNATRLLVNAMNKATYTAFYKHSAEIVGLHAMLAKPSNVKTDALLDLL
jgi:hypothetical protein